MPGLGRMEDAVRVYHFGPHGCLPAQAPPSRMAILK